MREGQHDLPTQLRDATPSSVDIATEMRLTADDLIDLPQHRGGDLPVEPGHHHGGALRTGEGGGGG